MSAAAFLSSIESVSYVVLRAMESFGISDAFSLSVRRLPWAECGSWEEHPVRNRVPQKDAPVNPSWKSTPWMPSQIQAISPLVDRLMLLIEGS